MSDRYESITAPILMTNDRSHTCCGAITDTAAADLGKAFTATGPGPPPTKAFNPGNTDERNRGIERLPDLGDGPLLPVELGPLFEAIVLRIALSVVAVVAEERRSDYRRRSATW